MGVTEIILLILGIALFVVSFVLPEKKTASADFTPLAEEKIKELAENEMLEIQSKLEDIVDDTVNQAADKVERAQERITNEKMMAIHEYSDTVLKEINKNHEEVVFLYDMLNDKQADLKNMLKDAVMTVKDIRQAAKDITAMPDSPKTPESESIERIEEKQTDYDVKVIDTENVPSDPEEKPVSNVVKAMPIANYTKAGIQFVQEQGTTSNSNEEILAMHKKGKTIMAIAKELGLGVGEVKLVIDLFEG